MLEKIPIKEDLLTIMGEEKFKAWSEINSFIDENYNVESIWNNDGKTGIYELKCRKGGKTLCALYPRESGMRILIVFGKAEREKFDASREEFTKYINDFYDNTHQYHDGKWLYLDLISDELTEDIKKLLLIKKKPSRQLLKQ
jgi:hypothetical protein